MFGLTAVFLPIAAFCMRYAAGKKYILENNCGPIVKQLQLFVFCIAIFALVIIDVMMFCLQGAANAEDFTIIATFYAIYLAAMVFALYPGFRNRLETGNEYGLNQTTRWNEFRGEEYV